MGIEKEDDSAADYPRVPERMDSSGTTNKSDNDNAVDRGISKGLGSSEVPPLPPTIASRQRKLPNQEDSINTSNPPPPLENLERNQYLRSSPGAVAVDGSGTTNVDDQYTISFSEERRNPVTAVMGCDEEGGELLSAEPIEDDDLAGDVEEQQEAAEMVAVELIDDQKAKNFLVSVRDRRVMLIFFGLLLVATALVTGLLVGPRQEINTKTFLFGTNSPTPVPVTDTPTSSPTFYFEFDPPSQEECRRIAAGHAVMNDHEDQILRNFEIQFDVSLSRNSEIENDEILSLLDKALQRTFATSLAGCDEVDYQRMLRRRLLRKNVVSNASFKSNFRESESCLSASPDICYRMVVTLELYLKGEERINKLLGLITSVFDRESLVDTLGLPPPFHSVLFAAIKSTDPTESPTQAPTLMPSRNSPNGNPSDGQSPIGNDEGDDEGDDDGDVNDGDHGSGEDGVGGPAEDDHNSGDDETEDDQEDEFFGLEDLVWDDTIEGDDDGVDDFFRDNFTGDDSNTDTVNRGDDAFGGSGDTGDIVGGNDEGIDDFFAHDNGVDDALNADDFPAHDDAVQTPVVDDVTDDDNIGRDDNVDSNGEDDIIAGGGDDTNGIAGDDATGQDDDVVPEQDDTIDDATGDGSPGQDDAIVTDDLAGGNIPTQNDATVDDLTGEADESTNDDASGQDDVLMDDDDGANDVMVDDNLGQDDATADDDDNDGGADDFIVDDILAPDDATADDDDDDNADDDGDSDDGDFVVDDIVAEDTPPQDDDLVDDDFAGDDQDDHSVDDFIGDDSTEDDMAHHLIWGDDDM